MRQRRVTGIEERLAPFADLILQGANGMSSGNSPPEPDDADDTSSTGQGENAAAYPLRWYERGSPHYMIPEGFGRVYVELGCGRGRFINALAAEDPEGLYIGVEGCKTILIRALEKTRQAGHANIRYIDGFINDAASAFSEGLLDGIFLNFSDPWPKIRHAERRLTAPAKAAAYRDILRPGGFVSLKTDNESFFKYSLEAFTDAGFVIEASESTASPADSFITGASHSDYISDVAERGAVLPANHCTTGASHSDYISDVAERGAVLPADDCTTGASHSDYISDVAERGAGTQTEYEMKFRARGLPIYYFKATKL